MSQRDAKMQWLKDVLDHLGSCRKDLEWTDDAEMVQVILEAMIRDLDCCRRLCQSLQQRTPVAA